MEANPVSSQIQDLYSRKDARSIRDVCASIHARDLAEILSGFPPKDAWELLTYLPPEDRADTFSHLREETQLNIANSLKRQELSTLFTDLPADDRADLFKALPEHIQEVLIPALAKAEREDILRLAAYREGTAGSAMTSDYVALSPEFTVRSAIEHLHRVAPDKETIYYAYVTDHEKKLVGLVSLKDLILAGPSELIGQIMNTHVILAQVSDDQEDAARKLQKYDLIALPVVNSQDQLVGIITYDDAIDIITQEQTEDLEKLMAIAGPHEAGDYLRTSPLEHFKRRCGWIIVLAGFGLISGFIVQNFEGLILQFTLLASFIPMLADTGGNTGSQSATLVIRALALKEISARDILRVLAKEFQVAVPLALVLGILAFGRVWLFNGQTVLPQGFSMITIALSVSAALALQVISATIIGAFLPLIVSGFKQDPAVIASPALTTIVDITGLLIFFYTIRLFLGI